MIGIIIQARTGSTRLPNKMIIPFFNGIGIFENILLRLKNRNLNIPIILATTKADADDVLVKIAEYHNISVFRGSEENVLERFIQTANYYGVEKIIRLCADNPFIDMKALEKQINEFERSEVDYWCYSLRNNTPTIKTHYGFWTEGVTLNVLKKVIESTNDELYLEHVTNYIYTNSKMFNIHYEYIPIEVEKEKNIRLTIDTEEDFNLAREIYSLAVENEIELAAEDMVRFIMPNKNWLKSMDKEIVKNLK